MSAIPRPLVAAATLAAATLAPAAPPATESAPPATPTLVRVTAWTRNPPADTTTTATNDPAADPPARTVASRAFGFVVESNGLLVTTYRTLLEPGGERLLDDLEVEVLTGISPTNDSRPADPVPANVVAVEPTLNFAVLRIDTDPPPPASIIADRTSIVEGATVHAPLEATPDAVRFARGILTRLNSMECYQESMTATMYQARIDLPDSALGAPVFRDDGAVVALHTGYTPRPDEDHTEPLLDTGEQHLLPIFLVFNIYESLKLRQSLESPWTGFSIRPLTAEEQALFPTKQRFRGGVAIDHVWKNSPAERLGIREDDLLVRFSYYPVTSPAEFQKWLYLHGVGHRIKLHFLRDGSDYRILDYVVEPRPAWARPK